MTCSHQRLLFFDYLSRGGLLLLLVFSAAAGEMDHKVAGDRFMIMCPGCVPELDEASHGKLLKHNITKKGGTIDGGRVGRAHHGVALLLAGQDGNKVIVVVPDGDDGLMASSLLERTTDADEPARHLPHQAGSCMQSLFITAAGDRSTQAFTVAAGIHDTSLSDPSVQIPQPDGGHERRINCSLPVAAAGRSHLHIATALSELNSDNNLQIQSSVADRLISLMIMAIMAIGGRRANERRKRTCSSAVVLTMLLVAAAFADSAMAARPLPAAATAGGHDEASASTTPGMPLNEAAAGHSSCTSDPNTQEPVRCIHH